MTDSGLHVWRIHGREREYFVARGDGKGPLLFLDPEAIAADLDRHLLDNPFGLLDLQAMLQAVDSTLLPGSGELSRPDSERRIRDRLVDAFLRQDLVVVTEGAPARVAPIGDTKAEPPKESKPAPAPAPLAPVVPKTWVAIQLVNEAGKPCAKEKFKVILPDGSTWEGKLDAEGKARKDGIADGPCKVSFPELGPATGKS